MTPIDEQILSQLIPKIAPQGQLKHVWPLSGGMSANMVAFEVENNDGQRVKLIRRSYGERPFTTAAQLVTNEFKLLQITQAAGLATPTPYYLDLSGEIFAQPYLVTDYLAGDMLFTPTDLDDYLRQFAAHLAQIHTTDYANYDVSFLPRAAKKCGELVGKRPSSPHPALRETYIRQTLSAHTPHPQHTPSTLLHGDYWPGNSLWHNNKLVAVIDWEDATWGDPLIDLAKSRSEIVWIFGAAAMDTFTQQYQALTALNYTHLPYWDLCAALRFIRIFGDDLSAAGAYFIPFGREDINEQVIQHNFNYFVDQAFDNLP